jgi:hypothetical protein
MPITAILTEPGSAVQPHIVAAYRPVLFRIRATATGGSPAPPVVYCDIYFNDIFYRSIPATKYAQLNAADSEWSFDIRDACQEYLRRDLPVNGGSVIVSGNSYIAKAFCRFRSSGLDQNNFIVSEDVAPVQGSGLVAPASGSGTESESFLVCNATLQHEHSQDLLTHLQYAIANGAFDALAYPLSHRPSPYRICKGNSDYFPFLYLGGQPFLKICISYRLKGSPNFTEACYALPQTCNSVVSNVHALVQDSHDTLVSFDVTAPATDFEYRLDNGSWLIVPSNPFTIQFRQLLMYLITEAGEQILLDQDGNILIPQDVQVYDSVHTADIRPRCSNGVYGTQGSANFEISSAPACDPVVLFSLSDIGYAPAQVHFNLVLPAGHADFQLEWKFDYGNGFVSPYKPIEDYTQAGPFNWNIPAGYPSGGRFIFHARTKCSPTSFSQWSADVAVNYVLPTHNINIVLTSITNANNGNYSVQVDLSEAVADDLTVKGYFQADGANGSIHTYGFTILIPHGATTGYGQVPGAPQGGSADLTRSRIEVVQPNPTSDNKTIIY